MCALMACDGHQHPRHGEDRYGRYVPLGIGGKPLGGFCGRGIDDDGFKAASEKADAALGITHMEIRRLPAPDASSR